VLSKRGQISERVFICSSAGVASPAKKKKMDQQNTSGWPLQTSGDVEPSPVSHGCRPWDRGDLFRRLATYKSISWFGKPQVQLLNKEVERISITNGPYAHADHICDESLLAFSSILILLQSHFLIEIFNTPFIGYYSRR